MLKQRTRDALFKHQQFALKALMENPNEIKIKPETRQNRRSSDHVHCQSRPQTDFAQKEETTNNGRMILARIAERLRGAKHESARRAGVVESNACFRLGCPVCKPAPLD